MKTVFLLSLVSFLGCNAQGKLSCPDPSGLDELVKMHFEMSDLGGGQGLEETEEGIRLRILLTLMFSQLDTKSINIIKTALNGNAPDQNMSAGETQKLLRFSEKYRALYLNIASPSDDFESTIIEIAKQIGASARADIDKVLPRSLVRGRTRTVSGTNLVAHSQAIACSLYQLPLLTRK